MIIIITAHAWTCTRRKCLLICKNNTGCCISHRIARWKKNKKNKHCFTCSVLQECIFSGMPLQVEDISTVISLQYFSVILFSFFSLLHFPPSECGMWQSELCVITQQETISLPHICCQGSAKNGAVLGLSDLTTSYGAPEITHS